MSGLVSRVASRFIVALAASTGAALVGFINAAAGAVARFVQDKLRERYSVDDFGAVGDGATDDTAAILAAIAALPASGWTLEFVRGKTYLVNAGTVNGLKLSNKSKFAIYGNGATIKVKNGEAVTGNHEILFFDNCQDGYVEKLFVDANRANRVPAEVGAHNIVIGTSCARLHFVDVRALNAVCDGWITQTGTVATAATYPADITLDNCGASNSYRNGLSAIGSLRLTVRGGSYDTSTGTAPQAGIDIEPDATYTYGNIDTVIDGVTLRGNVGYGIQVGGPVDLNTRVTLRGLRGSANGLAFINAGACNGLTLDGIDCGPHTAATRGVIDIGSNVKQVEIDGVRFRGITAGAAKSCLYVHGSVTGRPRIKNVSDIGSTAVVLSINKGSHVADFSSDGCTTDAVVIGGGTHTVIDGFDISNVTGRAIYSDASDTKLKNGTALDSASTTAAIQFDANALNSSEEGVSIIYSGAIPGGAVGTYWNCVPGRINDVFVRVNGAWATVAQFATFGAGVATSKIFDCVPHPLSTTAVYDPISLTAGDVQTTTYAITGAALGDDAHAAPGVDLNGIDMTVTAIAGGVRLTLSKNNAGAMDLASSTWKFWIDKR